MRTAGKANATARSNTRLIRCFMSILCLDCIQLFSRIVTTCPEKIVVRNLVAILPNPAQQGKRRLLPIAGDFVPIAARGQFARV